MWRAKQFITIHKRAIIVGCKMMRAKGLEEGEKVNLVKDLEDGELEKASWKRWYLSCSDRDVRGQFSRLSEKIESYESTGCEERRWLGEFNRNHHQCILSTIKHHSCVLIDTTVREFFMLKVNF
jgi:hypothetical protein